jgi:hypothetical protein
MVPAGEMRPDESGRIASTRKDPARASKLDAADIDRIAQRVVAFSPMAWLSRRGRRGTDAALARSFAIGSAAVPNARAFAGREW